MGDVHMKQQFGDRLRQLRTERNITQEELGKALNSNKSSISHYESNRRLPDANTISRFAEFFNVTVDYILGRSDIRTAEQPNTDECEIEYKEASQEQVYHTIKKVLVDKGLLKENEEISEKRIKEIELIFDKALEIYKIDRK